LQIVRLNLRMWKIMNENFPRNDIIFNPKATAVPYNYRISYKVSLICLIIGKCCGKKGCSAVKLQMINAAVSKNDTKRELLELLSKSLTTNEATLIRFDPAISRAINYAIADDLIYRQANGLFRLTARGKMIVKEVYEDRDLMIVEKELFEKISNKISEDLINRIAKNWEAYNA
jgi:hypothetical protein